VNRLEQMRAFVSVVEAAGYSRATRRTGLSRALLSRYVLELEEDLGAKLLERTTRSVTVTDDGQAFYERCRSILDEVRAAEHFIRERHTAPSGELRVAAPVNFGVGRLGECVSAFLSAYPDIQLVLSLNDDTGDPLPKGFDIAVKVGTFDSPPPRPMTAFKLTSSRRIICASPAYLDEHGRPQRPEDLENYVCLNYSYLSDPDIWCFRRNRDEVKVRVRRRLMTSSGTVIRQTALDGLGIAYGPVHFFSRELDKGSLVQILGDYDLPEVSIYSLSLPSERTRAKVTAFNEFMRTSLTTPG
jgi:DNA-binding transcriptional LysR family regulator